MTNTTDTNKDPSSGLHTTPKGTFGFPHLNTPDTKFNAKGVYKTGLVLTADEAEEIKALCQAAFDHFLRNERARLEKADLKPVERKKKLTLLERAPHYPVTEALDQETAESTGEWVVTFSIDATGVAKKTGREYSNAPVIWDNQDPPQKTQALIFNGAKGKITYVMQPYSTDTAIGVKLKPRAVQLIDLAERTTRGAADYGFKAEQGTFDPSKVPAPASATSAPAQSVEEGSDGDGSELL